VRLLADQSAKRSASLKIRNSLDIRRSQMKQLMQRLGSLLTAQETCDPVASRSAPLPDEESRDLKAHRVEALISVCGKSSSQQKPPGFISGRSHNGHL
jgi:hypothetical protein